MKKNFMANVDISLPAPMKDWVDGQAQSGRYSDASDCIRDLIRQDQARETKILDMQRIVNEGSASGVSDETMTDILESRKTRPNS